MNDVIIKKSELFVTPVWEIETGFDNEFNLKMIDELNSAKLEQKENNIWKTNLGTIDILKSKLFECLELTVKKYFPFWYPYNPILFNGWVTEHKPGESMPLHDHSGTVIACVYYVNCPEKCGDLLLIDPRGSANWDWKQDKNFYGTKYHRILPRESKLVIFPGYLMHMVEQNKSNQTRISIVTNLQNGDLSKLLS